HRPLCLHAGSLLPPRPDLPADQSGLAPAAQRCLPYSDSGIHEISTVNLRAVLGPPRQIGLWVADADGLPSRLLCELPQLSAAITLREETVTLSKDRAI